MMMIDEFLISVHLLPFWEIVWRKRIDMQAREEKREQRGEKVIWQ